MSITINDTTQDTTDHPTTTATSYEPVPFAPSPSGARSRGTAFLSQFASGTIKRRLLEASIAIAVAGLLVKFGGLVKEMAVAWRFGTSAELDAFNVAVAIPFALVNIIATPFQTAFLPVYAQVQQREGNAAAQQLFSRSLVWLLALFIVASSALVLSGPFYLPLLASGFSAENLRLAFRLLCLVSPMVLLIGTSFFLTGVLNVKDHFVIPAITPLLTTALTILLLVQAQKLGVYTLALGVTLGASVELFILAMVVRGKGISLRPCWPVVCDQLQQIIQNSLALILGNSLMAGTQLIGVAIAARMSVGSVAALSYANKVTLLSAGLIATSLGTVTLSFLARISAQEQWRELKSTLHHFLSIAFFITIPLTIVLMLFATPITRLLFQRGAFVTNDVTVVAILVFFFALQIPFYVANVLVAKVFLSLQLSRVILWASAINLAVYAGLAYLLSSRWGLVGIAIATSATYFCSFLFLYFLTTKKFKELLTQ
jgi:putative peptidoglycan lipid II flippase